MRLLASEAAVGSAIGVSATIADFHSPGVHYRAKPLTSHLPLAVNEAAPLTVDQRETTEIIPTVFKGPIPEIVAGDPAVAV
mgnify:CR=1 FL=1